MCASERPFYTITLEILALDHGAALYGTKHEKVATDPHRILLLDAVAEYH